MKLNFEQTADDSVAFLLHYQSNDRVYQGVIRVMRLIGPVIFLFLAVLIILAEDLGAGFKIGMCIFLGLVSLCFIIWTPKFFRYKNAKDARKKLSKPENAKFLGPRTLMFDEEGIRIEMKDINEEVKWGILVKAEVSDGYCFIYMSEAHALVVPLSRIPQSDAENLFALLKERNLLTT